ncbi:PTS system cellobiose-specific IIB component [Weissella uvarum]|uniref:PTS sugar transporter subunit IIB n=1 Tax=Weissella uvarum TaxID=1479233 RepID=UPI0019602882|nr:PTS sugar transporter subunit IIB [Weissella uvarum]MBM7616569.1 PTS system cellobiose-specific IIB component [Weissella uvarum]MCM0594971.1 PTS sugar transporter subunit IIB [Weissella uvarum]
MADKTIMLACAAGTSTSLMVQKIQEAAKAAGKDYEIFAKSTADLEQQLNSDKVPDAVLLGPQVSYLKDDIKKKTDAKGIPMDVMPMMDYGMMNGENILKFAEDLMEK